MAPPHYPSVGWDDCPPLTGVPENAPNGLALHGTERPKRWAQRFFHGILVQLLADRKLTVERMMSEGIGAFWLRFTAKELDDLLHSAAEEYSDVERIGELGDVHRKYRATEQGNKLRTPRSVSLTDTANVVLLVREAFKRWRVISGGLGALGITVPIFARQPWQRELAIAVALLSLLFLVLLFGYLGERDLKAAALAWPRLDIYRHEFYVWVTHQWRQVFFPTAGWFFSAMVALALLLRRSDTIASVFAGVAAVVVVVILVAYLTVRPLRKASAEERERVKRCRESEGQPLTELVSARTPASGEFR